MELAPPVIDAPKSRLRQPKYIAWTATPAKRALIAAAIVGVFADLVVRSHLVGLVGTLWLAAATLAVAAVATVPRRSANMMLLGLALVLAPWLTFRTSPWLVAPTLVAVAGLLLLGSARNTSRPLTFPAMAIRLCETAATCADAPSQAVRAIGALGWPTVLANPSMA